MRALHSSSRILAGLGIIVWLAEAANAQLVVEETEPVRKAPGVYVSFEGDLVGVNVAAVLEKLYEVPKDLPTEPYTTVAGDTVCGILDRRRYPPPCDALLPLLDKLNDRLKPLAKTPLPQKAVLTLPALEISRSSAIRVFSKSSPEQQARSKNLVSNWRHLEAQKVQPARPTDTFAVRYNAYELVIPTTDDAVALTLFERLLPLRSKSILISPLLINEVEPKFHSGSFPTWEAVQQYCYNGSLRGRNDRYFDLMAGDRDALPLIQGRPGPRTVPVYIVDTVLHSSPNLLAPPPGAAPAPVADGCPWGHFVKSLHHATHLAGLIASKGKPYFFEGLAPNASIRSYLWSRPRSDDPTKTEKARADRHIVLAKHFNDHFEKHLVLPVYLAALQFEDYLASSLVDGHLRSLEKRYEGRPLEQAIVESRPLLITAAGQPDGTDQPVPLSPTSPRSPQNLGTLENVVLVTACTTCDPKNPVIDTRANYSGPGFRMIHLAAPGGTPIPGWISDREIGAAAGTSQAAAFVAGLAASMIGHFPDIYTEARRVKKRLQVTSRPLPPQDDGTPNPAAKHLSAGIVDPVLALLDPRKHWMRENGVWKAVKVRVWSAPHVTFTYVNGASAPYNTSEVLRIVKMRTSSDAQADLWSAYVTWSDQDQPKTIDRRDLIQQMTGAALILCDSNEPKPLSKLDDIIFSVSGVQDNECAAN